MELTKARGGIVFVLGAGASKAAGVPLMRNFLDVARDLWIAQKVEVADQQFRLVFEGLSALQGVHSKADLDIHNVEKVFSAFEMAATLSKLGDFPKMRIAGLLPAMKTVIGHTVEATTQFPVVSGSGMAPGLDPPLPYRAFGNLVSVLKAVQPVSVISFNYDLAADFALHRSGTPVDYGLGPAPAQYSVPLLKLHGSLNWGTAADSEEVVPVPIARLVQHLDLGWTSSRHTFLPCSILLPRFSSAKGQHLNREPVIVPPTMSKQAYHVQLSQVWQRAAEVLGQAESIYIIGFSLSYGDSFFEHLYALGSLGANPLRRFCVIDPDSTVPERFGALLGPGAKQRFSYEQATFAAILEKEFEKWGEDG